MIGMWKTMWPRKDICETIWDHPGDMSQSYVDHWSSCLQHVDRMSLFIIQNLTNIWQASNKTVVNSSVTNKDPSTFSHTEAPLSSC